MRRSGFTLIELLVVVGIIAILLALLIPAIGLSGIFLKKVDGAQRVMQISAAVATYHDANGSYPELRPDGTRMDADEKANAPGLFNALQSVGRGDIAGFATGGVYFDHWGKTCPLT